MTTQIFISHSHDDVACADRIREGLEAAGYAVWKDTQSITPGSPSYVRAIENGIRGSAATIVVWSASAAVSEWVEREILFSQQLQKPIYPVVIDGTEPSIILIAVQSVTSAPPCADAVALLLPHLPPPDSDDELMTVAALLAHEHIKVRKEGIARAARLLAAGQHREPILALLEDIARKDLISGVRESARRVLDAERQKNTPPARPDESRHIFGARCPNGHITYFDRRRVCPDSGTFVRQIVHRGGTELDEIYLKCETCGCEFSVPVDCEGYK